MKLPAQPALLWVLYSTQRNISISSGTPQTRASEHSWGSNDSLGFAGSDFPSDPLSSAMLDQLKIYQPKEGLGAHYFFFPNEISKGQPKGEGFHQCLWQVKIHSHHHPHNPAMPVPCRNCPSTEPVHSCNIHSRNIHSLTFPAYSLEQPLMARMTPHLFW